ncbi:MAG: carboxypeptidase-like regulatory domain-containing protein [Thermoleophilia bacterium]
MTRRPVRRRAAALAALAAGGLAGLTFATGSATAAACAAGLTVRGVPVTGDDCVTGPDGGITIKDPRFLTGGAVKITGRMVLNAARSEMVQEQTTIPLALSVGTRPVFAGKFRVGLVRLCDLKTPTTTNPSTGGPFQASNVTDERVFLPNETGCRDATGIQVTEGVSQLTEQLAGVGLENVDARPIFGMDDLRGGRVFGQFATVLNRNGRIPGVQPFRLGVGAEVSLDQGLRPTGGGFNYAGSVSVIPGVQLVNPALAVDVPLQRYSGFVQMLILRQFFAEAGLSIQAGDISSVSLGLSLVPAIGIGPPPILPPVRLKSISASIERGSTTVRPGGGTSTSPVRLRGTLGWDGGPPLAFADERFFTGTTTLTVAGPAIELQGTVFGLQQKLKLGNARVLVAFAPFRFEADATAELTFTVRNKPLTFVKGQLFLGVTSDHFTALGNVLIQIPDEVPLAGGQTLAGASAVISDKAAAAGLVFDPPLLAPRFVGVAFTFNPVDFKVVNSLEQFITVTPSGSLERGAAGALDAQRLVLPKAPVLTMDVAGRTRPPRAVRVIGPGGRAVTPAGQATLGNTRILKLANVRPGRYRVVSPDTITRIGVARPQAFTYLDPRDGYGTRPRPPVAEGTPVNVCWDVRNAPADAVVDLFEDTNGSRGTGRDIATGLPASGCFDVPTTGLEPGRHWVYGVVRQGDTPLSANYWPLGITVTDPDGMAPPTGLKVRATADGAKVTFNAVTGADGYIVRARADGDPFPANETVVPVGDAATVTANVSLRGAKRWFVSVQAVRNDGTRGNISREIGVSPTQPVVLDGEPTGLARVGKPWAFQLDAEGLTSLRLVKGPRGSRISRSGLVTWRPSAKAGKAAPVTFAVKGCRGSRCLTREFTVAAYQLNWNPAAPARGFTVLGNVVTGGERVGLRVAGIRGPAVVTVDGRRVRSRVRDGITVEFTVPRGLARGAHDVSLQIGGDPVETREGALIVR